QTTEWTIVRIGGQAKYSEADRFWFVILYTRSRLSSCCRTVDNEHEERTDLKRFGIPALLCDQIEAGMKKILGMIGHEAVRARAAVGQMIGRRGSTCTGRYYCRRLPRSA